MIKLLFPDPLIWQAGVEYGLQALAGLSSGEWVCGLPNHGPMLESTAFAIHQLGLQDRVKFQSRHKYLFGSSQIALFPRVAPLNRKLLLRNLKRGQIVVTSDPSIDFEFTNLFVFPKRDWYSLREILLNLMGQKR